MRFIAIGLILVFQAACQYTVFARPEVVYSTPTTVGVRYIAAGIQGRYNERQAMRLIEEHCRGRYQVTGRSEGQASTIDAVCAVIRVGLQLAYGPLRTLLVSRHPHALHPSVGDMIRAPVLGSCNLLLGN